MALEFLLSLLLGVDSRDREVEKGLKEVYLG
jgi:hypothetical protein